MMVMMVMMTTTTTMTLCKEIMYSNVVKQLMLHVTERMLHALEYNNTLIHLYGSKAPLTHMLTICRQFAGGNDVSYCNEYIVAQNGAFYRAMLAQSAVMRQ